MSNQKKISKRDDGLWVIEGNELHTFRTKAAAEGYLGVSSRRVNKSAIKLLLVFAAVAFGIWAASGLNNGKTDDAGKMDALLLCQKAIEAAALYGNDNRPGHTFGKKIGEVWQFLWQHGSFHFKNGFGVDVPQSARCEVDVSTGRIVYLFVSGQTIIQ